MVRVFVALPISGGLQADILAWEEIFQHLPVRWLDGKNLHITLVPPWHVEDADIPKPCKLLEEVAKNTKTFEVKFQKVSFGSDPKHPRFIWAEGEAPEAAERFKKISEETFGVKSEYRPGKCI